MLFSNLFFVLTVSAHLSTVCFSLYLTIALPFCLSTALPAASEITHTTTTKPINNNIITTLTSDTPIDRYEQVLIHVSLWLVLWLFSQERDEWASVTKTAEVDLNQ